MKKTTVFVGAVVRQGDRVLLVRQSSGHPLEGQWTIPWGSVENGESAVSAATRETWEEGGVRASVEGLLGVQELPSPQDGCIAIIYMCKHLGGAVIPQDKETNAARYYSHSDLDVISEPLEPWSEWLVRRVFSGEVTITPQNEANPLQLHGAFL